MMKAAFYKGKGVGGTWKQKVLHWGISRLSDPHTHVELINSEGLSHSSEFGLGPRIKEIDYTHPERWTFIDLPFIDRAAEGRIWYRAKVLVGLQEAGLIKYDTRGAIGCTITGRENPWNYFCSEDIYECLAPEIAIPALNHKMIPQKLLEVLLAIKLLY